MWGMKDDLFFFCFVNSYDLLLPCKQVNPVFKSHHKNIYLICLYDSSHLHGLSDLPLKTLIKPFCERCLPTPAGKEYLRKWRDREESEWSGLAKFALFTILTSPFPVTSSHDLTLFSKPGIKSQVLLFLQVFISFWRLLCHAKLLLNAFLWLICLCYRGSSWENLKG